MAQQEPPKIGVAMFPEEYDKKNQKFAPDLAVDEDTTVSCSLHVMYIDLCGWKVVISLLNNKKSHFAFSLL